jgi:hypothetical protein
MTTAGDAPAHERALLRIDMNRSLKELSASRSGNVKPIRKAPSAWRRGRRRLGPFDQ